MEKCRGCYNDFIVRTVIQLDISSETSISTVAHVRLDFATSGITRGYVT